MSGPVALLGTAGPSTKAQVPDATVPLMAREAHTAARVSTALAVVVGLAACGSSSPQPAASGCTRGGTYCVSIEVTGSLSGHLATAHPPAGFAELCQQLSRPRVAWISHVYGTLNGEVWHLVVETSTYTGPGSYTALLTFGTVQPITGAVTSVPVDKDKYVGQGTATVGEGGASATLRGSLNIASSNRTISVSGSLSCQPAATK